MCICKGGVGRVGLSFQITQVQPFELPIYRIGKATRKGCVLMS